MKELNVAMFQGERLLIMSSWGGINVVFSISTGLEYDLELYRGIAHGQTRRLEESRTGHPKATNNQKLIIP
jgi:hypothetical protein